MVKSALFLFFLTCCLQLNAQCINDKECHLSRKCHEKLCYFEQDLKADKSAGFMVELFFKALKQRVFDSFILTSDQYRRFCGNDEDLYTAYYSVFSAETVDIDLDSDDTFVSFLPGKIAYVEDLKGNVFTVYQDSEMLVQSKGGKRRIHLDGVIHLDGRWVVLTILSDSEDICFKGGVHV